MNDNPGRRDFAFSDQRLAIRRFDDDDKRLAERPGLSSMDRDIIDNEDWAIVAEANDLQGYELDVNMLLIAFRLLSDWVTPKIKYRLSEGDEYAKRLDETEFHVLLPGYKYQTYSLKDLGDVDRVYMMLRSAELISVRLRNAFYFLYRAFYSCHWVDGFLFYMNALESLFSLDKKGPVTKTMRERISKLLKAPKNAPKPRIEKTVEDLYDVRSRIVHGRLEARPDSVANKLLLKKMERVTKLCFRRLIAENSFQYFATASSRDQFFAAL